MRRKITAKVQLELKPASAIDAAAVASLVNAAFRRYAILTADRTSAEALLDEAGDTGEFIHAYNGERLVGSAMVQPATATFANAPQYLQSAIDVEGALYFGLAAVDPFEMNTGIGRILIGEAERLGQERGYRRVVLGTVREFGLVDYYARQGYLAVNVTTFPAGHWNIITPHRYYEMVKEL
jgi:predicted N-acetyltransferase YhbS